VGGRKRPVSGPRALEGRKGGRGGGREGGREAYFCCRAQVVLRGARERRGRGKKKESKEEKQNNKRTTKGGREKGREGGRDTQTMYGMVVSMVWREEGREGGRECVQNSA